MLCFSVCRRGRRDWWPKCVLWGGCALRGRARDNEGTKTCSSPNSRQICGLESKMENEKRRKKQTYASLFRCHRLRPSATAAKQQRVGTEACEGWSYPDSQPAPPWPRMAARRLMMMMRRRRRRTWTTQRQLLLLLWPQSKSAAEVLAFGRADKHRIPLAGGRHCWCLWRGFRISLPSPPRHADDLHPLTVHIKVGSNLCTGCGTHQLLEGMPACLPWASMI
ncbi:hypothetical protein BHE74_00049193 [Ensete ventricosum]|nr:hypothetical protein BHE74_00049193 [Ensete ventricosum]RZS22416.1 hypothetical protein BHM03_00055183 [Ensete ventricosum]